MYHQEKNCYRKTNKYNLEHSIYIMLVRFVLSKNWLVLADHSVRSLWWWQFFLVWSVQIKIQMDEAKKSPKKSHFWENQSTYFMVTIPYNYSVCLKQNEFILTGHFQTKMQHKYVENYQVPSARGVLPCNAAWRISSNEEIYVL